MKTLTKTSVFSLIFSLTLMFASYAPAKADCFSNACPAPLTSDTLSAKENSEDEFDFDFADPLLFSDQVVVHIYNEQDELLFNQSYSKEEARRDPKLKALLKSCDFLLSIDDKHFYYIKSKGI